MKRIELEEQNGRKKRYRVLTCFVVGMTILLSFLQLLLSNHLASTGSHLLGFREKESQLSLENETLKKEIAKETSISTISQKAQVLTLAIPSNFLVVEEGSTFALQLPR